MVGARLGSARPSHSHPPGTPTHRPARNGRSAIIDDSAASRARSSMRAATPTARPMACARHRRERGTGRVADSGGGGGASGGGCGCFLPASYPSARAPYSLSLRRSGLGLRAPSLLPLSRSAGCPAVPRSPEPPPLHRALREGAWLPARQPSRAAEALGRARAPDRGDLPRVGPHHPIKLPCSCKRFVLTVSGQATTHRTS